jgi:hypothetical protein
MPQDTSDGGSGSGSSNRNGGTMTLVNSTVSSNHGAAGIANDAALVLVNSTVANNVAGDAYPPFALGGGIVNRGTATVRNSLIAGNSRFAGDVSVLEPSDCDGVLTSEGFNLVESTAGCTLAGDLTGVLTGVDPLLGALGDNGGPVPTHALRVGSPAINAGNPSGCLDAQGNPLSTDQRGFPRPSGPACDIGAFEQTQPDAALGMCAIDLADCRADLTPDTDGDGEIDLTDRCPGTPMDVAVDDAGCSLAQFCARFDVTTREGKRACKRADWKNDEPLRHRSEMDCTIAKGGHGPEDDACVPTAP